jgi:hypothetical protein
VVYEVIAMLEFGILGKIGEIQDDSMKFYALIGLCVSTSAEIEHRLFDSFYATCGKKRKQAADEFYKGLNFEPKLKMADASVQAILADGETLKFWKEIISEVRDHCTGDTVRNLVSHNALALNLYIKTGADGVPDIEKGSAVRMELAVHRNSNVVLAGKRPPAKQTLEGLFKFVYAILDAELRLMDFYQRYLAGLSRPDEK